MSRIIKVDKCEDCPHLFEGKQFNFCFKDIEHRHISELQIIPDWCPLEEENKT